MKTKLPGILFLILRLIFGLDCMLNGNDLYGAASTAMVFTSFFCLCKKRQILAEWLWILVMFFDIYYAAYLKSILSVVVVVVTLFMDRLVPRKTK